MKKNVSAIALVAAILAATSAGAAVPALTVPQGLKIANKVRHRDLHDAFGLRERIGGAFHLGLTYCEPGVTPQRVLCKYDATQIGTDAKGMRTFCTITVRVRRRSMHRTTWRRSLGCATDFRPAPPATS